MTRPEAASTPPAPIEAISAPVDRFGRLGHLPKLLIRTVRLVYAAAPRPTVVALVLQLASAVLIGVQLLLAKVLISHLLVLARDSSASIAHLLPAFVGLLVATALSNGISSVLVHHQRLLGELVARRTMDEIIDVASDVDLESFEDSTFYDQLERASAAATFRPLEIVNSLMQLLLAVLTIGGITVAMLTLQPILLPLALLAGVPVLIATIRNSRKGYAFEYGMTTHARERLHLLELLTGRASAKELRVFSATRFLRTRYDALSDERVEHVREFLRGRMFVSLVGSAAGAVATAVALGSLAWLISTHRIGVATAATAAVAMQVMAGRLSAVTSALGSLVEGGLFIDNLHAFLAYDPARRRSARSVASGMVAAPEFEVLRVSGLSFSYPRSGTDVLRDVSLEIRRGEVIAIVGENGSGKTTLVKLLCQLYAPTRGQILWNGRDTRTIDPDSVLERTTVLFQDFVQYHLTVSDNIVLGRGDDPPDETRIREAARRSGAEPMVERLPQGFGSRLGRQFLGGVELSGGQWQRLALARAFYRGGDFLILDEPTAALDPRAEHRLFEQMRELAEGKSVLLISHRFANVRMADRIYVLKEGAVVESGPHDELMAEDGLYAELFRLQAAAYTESPRTSGP